MQTFLPYADFKQSAKTLDRLRLGNQRNECKVIYNSIVLGTGWPHHVVTKMWHPYKETLIEYAIAICEEWIGRGYKDSTLPFFLDKRSSDVIMPPWLGDERVHSSHRSNLLRKNYEYYSQFGWKEEPSQEYYYPRG